MGASLSLYLKRFFSGVFLSRLSGLGRDLAMAFAFGDHPSVAAFFVAFRLANLLRRLLGEGPFQSAFIPYFEELKAQSQEKAFGFFRQLTTLLTFFLLLLTVFVELALFFLLSNSFFSESSREIVILTMWLFPAIIFICLYGLNISLMQCFNSFFVPSFAPFICNLIWIFGALLLKSKPPAEAMIFISQFVVIGFVGQWLVTLPLTLKQVSAGFKEWLFFKADALSKLTAFFQIPLEVKKLFRSFAVTAVGVGALQINAFIDTLFARYADLKGPVYLWYSIRLQQLALAIFGIACINTIVPSLARALKRGQTEEAKALFNLSYQRILAVMVPSCFAILILGPAALNLLYGRGHFSSLALFETSWCLWLYGLGLVPAVMTILFSSFFYARNNFWLPTKISLLSVVLNIVLNGIFVFVFQMKAESIALATSLSAWLNFLMLKNLAWQQGWQEGLSFFKTAKIALTGFFAFLLTFLASLFFDQTFLNLFLRKATLFSTQFSSQVWQFFWPFSVFLASLAFFTWLFKTREILAFAKELLFKTADVKQ